MFLLLLLQWTGPGRLGAPCARCLVGGAGAGTGGIRGVRCCGRRLAIQPVLQAPGRQLLQVVEPSQVCAELDAR